MTGTDALAATRIADSIRPVPAGGDVCAVQN
jgi:hypothetical protein